MLLVTGHPRTGTGYVAKVLQSLGFEIGHEHLGMDGIVSWQIGAGYLDKVGDYFMMSHFRRENDLICARKGVDFIKYTSVAYCVRDPYYSIPSIAETEEISLAYRAYNARFPVTGDCVIDAITSLYFWELLIHDVWAPDYIFKVDGNIKDFIDWLVKSNIRPHNKKELDLHQWARIPNNVNTRRHRPLSELKFNRDLLELRIGGKKVSAMLFDYCVSHDYDYDRIMRVWWKGSLS